MLQLVREKGQWIAHVQGDERERRSEAEEVIPGTVSRRRNRWSACAVRVSVGAKEGAGCKGANSAPSGNFDDFSTEEGESADSVAGEEDFGSCSDDAWGAESQWVRASKTFSPSSAAPCQVSCAEVSWSYGMFGALMTGNDVERGVLHYSGLATGFSVYKGDGAGSVLAETSVPKDKSELGENGAQPRVRTAQTVVVAGEQEVAMAKDGLSTTCGEMDARREAQASAQITRAVFAAAETEAACKPEM